MPLIKSRGKCPGDHPCENEDRPVQPQSVPTKKPTFDVTSMWKSLPKPSAQAVRQNSAAIADRKDQMDRLKNEY